MKDVKEAWVVDDDDVFIFVFREVLKKCKIFKSISSFIHQEHALEQLLERKNSGSELPEVIFCDYRLNLYTALDFIKDVTDMQLDPMPRIICITVSTHPTDIDNIVKNGIPYLNKPVTKEDVLKITEEVLR